MKTMKSEIQTGLRLKTKTREIVSTTFWYQQSNPALFGWK